MKRKVAITIVVPLDLVVDCGRPKSVVPILQAIGRTVMV